MIKDHVHRMGQKRKYELFSVNDDAKKSGLGWGGVSKGVLYTHTHTHTHTRARARAYMHTRVVRIWIAHER